MLLASLIASSAALAHHSNAEYDRSVLRDFEGELAAVVWANPHVMFKLRLANEAGEVQEWELGYSVGHWDGDTLEVRTSRIGWPYLDDEGRPQTETVDVLERFALLEGGGRLRYTQTVTDAYSLVEPMTVSWDYVADAAEELTPVSCQSIVE